MSKFQLAAYISILLFVSCSNAHQYDVYVQNDSGSEIRVAFKSLKDRDGIKEESVNLKNGAYQQIISTVDIASPEGSMKPRAEDCHLVAEYINAYSGDSESSLQWCDSDINFVVEDIGEGRFTMIFKPQHFE